MKQADLIQARFAVLWKNMQKRGFDVVTPDHLSRWVQQYSAAVLLLSSDPIKTPEVSDNIVIIPEILALFPAYSWRIGAANLEDSEIFADSYKISKYPAVLFFLQGELLGSLSGLYPWQELLARVRQLLRDDRIPLQEVGHGE